MAFPSTKRTTGVLKPLPLILGKKTSRNQEVKSSVSIHPDSNLSKAPLSSKPCRGSSWFDVMTGITRVQSNYYLGFNTGGKVKVFLHWRANTLPLFGHSGLGPLKIESSIISLSINNKKNHPMSSSSHASTTANKTKTTASSDLRGGLQNQREHHIILLLSIGRDGQLHTSLYDKRDDFNFHITNFPFLSSNIPSSPAYGVFISQLIRYARACSSYECFILRAMRLSNKLLGQGYVKERLKSSLRKFYGRYGDLTKQYEVPLSRMLHDILDDDHIQ